MVKKNAKDNTKIFTYKGYEYILDPVFPKDEEDTDVGIQVYYSKRGEKLSAVGKPCDYLLIEFVYKDDEDRIIDCERSVIAAHEEIMKEIDVIENTYEYEDKINKLCNTDIQAFADLKRKFNL